MPLINCASLLTQVMVIISAAIVINMVTLYIYIYI